MRLACESKVNEDKLIQKNKVIEDKLKSYEQSAQYLNDFMQSNSTNGWEKLSILNIVTSRSPTLEELGQHLEGLAGDTYKAAKTSFDLNAKKQLNAPPPKNRRKRGASI